MLCTQQELQLQCVLVTTYRRKLLRAKEAGLNDAVGGSSLEPGDQVHGIRRCRGCTHERCEAKLLQCALPGQLLHQLNKPVKQCSDHPRDAKHRAAAGSNAAGDCKGEQAD